MAAQEVEDELVELVRTLYLRPMAAPRENKHLSIRDEAGH